MSYRSARWAQWIAFAGTLIVAADAGAQADAALDARLDALDAQVTAAEDVSAIKRLQREYGYYVDKGMWEDVADLYADDAVANYPAGTYIGKASIRKHLYMNVGGGQVGENGLPENRLYNHINIQPVVHLDAGGETAKGRWRAFAMFGSFGGGATWAEGVYEMTYAKDHGVWKIKNLDYHSGFGAAYATGWVPPEPRPAAATGGGGGRGGLRNLPYPADKPREEACPGFPAACVGPFHYTNPGITDAGHVWTTVALSPAAGRKPAVRDRAQALAQRTSTARGRAGHRESTKDLRLLPRPAHVGRRSGSLRRQRHDRDGPAGRVRRQGPRSAVPESAGPLRHRRRRGQRPRAAAGRRRRGTGRPHGEGAQPRAEHDRRAEQARRVERGRLREHVRQGRRRVEAQGSALLPHVHHRLRPGLGQGCETGARRQQGAAARSAADERVRDLSEAAHPAVSLRQSRVGLCAALPRGARPAERRGDRGRARSGRGDAVHGRARRRRATLRRSWPKQRGKSDA